MGEGQSNSPISETCDRLKKHIIIIIIIIIIINNVIMNANICSIPRGEINENRLENVQ
jgi:accessory gene regulator protein AgrB